MKESNCFLCFLPPIPFLPASLESRVIAALLSLLIALVKVTVTTVMPRLILGMYSTGAVGIMAQPTASFSWHSSSLGFQGISPSLFCSYFAGLSQSLYLVPTHLSGFLTNLLKKNLLSALIPLVISSSLMTVNAIYMLRTPKFISVAQTFPPNKINLYTYWLLNIPTRMSNRYVKNRPKLNFHSPYVPFSPQSAFQAIVPVFINDKRPSS